MPNKMPAKAFAERCDGLFFENFILQENLAWDFLAKKYYLRHLFPTHLTPKKERFSRRMVPLSPQKRTGVLFRSENREKVTNCNKIIYFDPSFHKYARQIDNNLPLNSPP